MTLPRDYFRRIWDDAAVRLDREVLGDVPADSYHARPQAIDAYKHTAYVVLSDDAAMDMGLIPDTRPPVHIPWRTRLRWKLSAWRERVGRKVGGWIAGVDLSERDDW